MTDTVTITNIPTQPTLVEQAEAAGINVNEIDNTAQGQTTPVDRPPGLPQKFKSWEDMAKSYAELEKKLGTAPAKPSVVQETVDDEALPSDAAKGATEGVEPEVDNPGEAKAVPETAEEAVQSAGLKFNELQAHYDAEGALSEDHYAALEKAGIPKHMVDEYIEGREAIRDTHRQQVFSIGGGEERFTEMMKWGADNFTEAEIDVFNKDINSTDKNRREAAARNLVARYESTVGSEPQRTVGGTVKTPSASVYESVNELQADMSDKRYGKDPAYTKRVEQKLARSNIL